MNQAYFDELIERKNTDCVKWDGCNEKYGVLGEQDLLPMWIADMDFKAPKAVIDEMVKRAGEGIYGYTTKPNSFYDAIIKWMDRHYRWKVQKEWIVFTPGVIPALNIAIQAFTKEGDGVIVQPPVYYPFMDGVNNNQRKVIENKLLFIDGKYEIDFEDLEKKAKDPVNKLMILCSPHNPVGRVWSKEELGKIGDICACNGVLLLSDEIHGDLIMEGQKHTATATISEDISENTIAAYAPSKTFNLAGLQTAYVVIANEEVRNLFLKGLTANRIFNFNFFGGIALEVAYNQCDEYVAQLCKYLGENFDYMEQFLKQHLPQLEMVHPQGTYLAWVSFKKTKMNREELEHFIIQKAQIGVDFGTWFGAGGEEFLRFNIACPRATLEKAMIRLKAAFEE